MKKQNSTQLMIRLMLEGKPYLGRIGLVFAIILVMGGLKAFGFTLLKPFMDGPAAAAAEAGSVEGLSWFNAWITDLKTFGYGLTEPLRNWLTGLVAGWTEDPVIALRFKVALVCLALGPLVGLLHFLQYQISASVYWSCARDLRNRLAQKLLDQPLSYLENRNTGEMISRVSNDINFLQQIFMFFFSNLISAPILVCWGIGVLLVDAERQQIFLALLLLGPVLFIPTAMLGRKIKKYSRKGLDGMIMMVDIMNQVFNGIRTVKVHNMEQHEKDQFALRNTFFYKAMMKVARARGASTGIMTGLNSVSIGICLLVAAWYGISAGNLLTVLATLGAFIYQPIKSLQKAYNTMQNALPAAEAVYGILDKPLQGASDLPNAKPMGAFAKDIVFDVEKFGYEKDNWVIQDFKLTVAKGQTIALVGHTGSGKSTVVDLLSRFYPLDHGTITLDGQDIKLLTHKSLLENISIVSQVPHLFDLTIEENIKYGKPEAAHEEVEQVAKAAGIHDTIMDHPEGYQRKVGEGGVQLSGGERQRICIARALLRNAPILILDEATSSLDTKTERAIQSALTKLMEGRTSFVVAHRLSTIQHADLIMVMQDGRVVDRGTHEELLARGGLYAGLVAAQSQA